MRNKLVALRLEDAGDMIIVTGFKPNEKNRKAVWTFKVPKATRRDMLDEVAIREHERLGTFQD